MPIEWNDNLKTGIPIIDEQHQEFLVMLNRLGRFRCGSESFSDTLKELQDFVETHFKDEEDYMVSSQYPKYDEHKSAHDKFVEDLKIINKRMDSGENICDLGDETFHFVEDWILNHYTNEDVELVKYIKKHS